MRVLVTGGARSGKSHHAEGLLSGRDDVTYVAAGPTTAEDPDPDWATRVVVHRSRRPASWATLETRDLEWAIATARGPVLVDCLGTWLAGVLDEHAAWDLPADDVVALVTTLLAGAVGALSDAEHDVVLVTDEVGLGVVPAYRSGRLFRDLLGAVNQQVAAVCDELHLVVAGRVLVL